MKTKEGVIKEYWGISIYSGSVIDKNGWLSDKYLTNKQCVEFNDNSNLEYNVELGYRPKSLRGIENNNGWIRIESKDDLPIDNGGSYMVCEKGIPREEYQMPRESLAKGWSCGVITHYKPIVKHKKPLY